MWQFVYTLTRCCLHLKVEDPERQRLVHALATIVLFDITNEVCFSFMLACVCVCICMHATCRCICSFHSLWMCVCVRLCVCACVHVYGERRHVGDELLVH